MPAPLIAAAVSAVAPALAKRGLDLLSGVFRGALDQGTQQVAELIHDKTGIDVNDIADEKLSDEQWRQLKEFELANQEQLLTTRQASEAHELEMERLRVQDSANARAAATQRDANDDRFVRRFTYYYAYLITGLTFFFIFAVIGASVFKQAPINPDAWRMIDTVLGFLLGVGLSAIIQFFFGSSQGSHRKGEQLEALARATSSEGRSAP
ncbi:hypothetical protein [Plasticicumulans acidivorans]|uniref:Uncharacterized protein n=1 Tax=Plasticicumulans acidivorans TaxID=886464 RepID=A0A317MVH1_9GAMM|nr:hypothetical protein [Plasticicumulans acidivorans]PWV62247.1 hypothetical protein C7443_10441 [Plasticicumulans acidivorans]